MLSVMAQTRAALQFKSIRQTMTVLVETCHPKASGRLSILDRYLTLWILLAMLVCVALGRLAPSITPVTTLLSISRTLIAIASGLILMMYPPLAKVRYERLPEVFRNTRVLRLDAGSTWRSVRLPGKKTGAGLACPRHLR